MSMTDEQLALLKRAALWPGPACTILPPIKEAIGALIAEYEALRPTAPGGAAMSDELLGPGGARTVRILEWLMRSTAHLHCNAHNQAEAQEIADSVLSAYGKEHASYAGIPNVDWREQAALARDAHSMVCAWHATATGQPYPPLKETIVPGWGVPAEAQADEEEQAEQEQPEVGPGGLPIDGVFRRLNPGWCPERYAAAFPLPDTDGVDGMWGTPQFCRFPSDRMVVELHKVTGVMRVYMSCAECAPRTGQGW
jgi:hypothetical protein